MAQDLADFEAQSVDTDVSTRRRRIDRSTAQALAAALSALAVATIVVTTSSSALTTRGAAQSSEVETGSITLADDDGGRSLVDLDAMAPGRPRTECINIAYTGSVLPVDLALVVESVGDIADYVDVRVDRGSSGGFGACELFVPEERIIDARLGDVLGEPQDVGGFSNEGESATYRFTFELIDESSAAGRSGTVDFVWEATPS
ncbi:MAG: hypothetical protein AAGG08_09795 [Actinomycetota bacterium]